MSMEKQMIRFMNIARQNPKHFIPILEKQIASFTNDRQIPLTEEIIYETNQGKQAWIEALAFLKQQKPIEQLQVHEGLNHSAQDHAIDLSKRNIFGHTGSDGSNFSQRILRYCRKGHGSMAELIGADFNYENRNHAEMTILGLIIDDGVTDRGHRKTIFNSQYKFIGCKSQPQGDKIITVFNITENNLALRTSSSFGNSALQNTGNNLTHKTSNQKMGNTSSSGKSYTKANEDKFSKTEWNSEQKSSNRYSNQPNFVDPKNKSRFAQTFDNFGQTLTKKSNMTSNSQNRKLKEKKQSSKIFYEDGSKITEVTTKLIYNDGTVEEKVEKHTIYLQE